MKKLYLLLYLQCIITVPALGQKTSSYQLHAGIPSEAFFINNEYFGKLVKGYTLPGFYTSPQVSIRWEQIALRGGLHALKYAGDDHPEKVLPFLGIDYRPNSNFTATVGALQAEESHRLPDILYHKEKRITQHIEEGVSFTWESEALFSDLWVNWEHFIQRGDSAQERFVAGTSTIYNATGKIKLHGKALAAHRGGQINRDTSRIQTLVNTQTGISWLLPMNQHTKIEFHAHLFGFYDASPKPELQWTSGWTMQTGFLFSFRRFTLNASFMRGRHFLSSHGNPLFQSVSQRKPHAVYPNRQILATGIGYTYKIAERFAFDTGASFFQQWKTGDLDYRYWFTMRIKPEFRLNKP